MPNTDSKALTGLLAALDKPAKTAESQGDTQIVRELHEVLKETRERVAREIPALVDKPKILDRLSEVYMGTVLALGDDATSQEVVEDAVGQMIQVLTDHGVVWALRYTEIVVETKYRPAYDKAVKANIDPAAFLQAHLNMRPEHAQKIAEAIKAEIDSAKPVPRK